MPEYRQTELDLSNEDSLRLNILLCQDVYAIRINESQLILYALISGDTETVKDTDRVKQDREVSVKLTPNCNADKYLKTVKAFLASYYLDSPAGFPIFMNRWTRTGQLKNEKVGEFLKIGEPEAVIAVTYGEKISIDHAKYAWWANPSVESARQLLTHDNVAKSELATDLADFLLEFLPFETEAKNIVLTVKLLLQRGLMDEANKQSLWKKGQRKSAYLIGFLSCDPKHIPEKQEPHPLNRMTDNQSIQKLLGVDGHTFNLTCLKALDGFSDQDSIVLLYEAMSHYYSGYAPGLKSIENDSDETFSDQASSDQTMRPVISALLALSKIDQNELIPVLAHSNAVGSLLRRKLAAVIEPVKNHLYILTHY